MTAGPDYAELTDVDSHLSFERIVFFSDAVFAIAMTLLALEIKVPSIAIPPGLSADQAGQYVNSQLPNEVAKLGPVLLSYFVSFSVLGLFWAGHHRSFGFIKRYDGTLIWLNLTYLMVVAFVPFPTSLMGQYGYTQFAVILYALTMVAFSILALAIWVYATYHRRLVDPDLDEKIVRYHILYRVLGMLVFLVSIPVAIFVHPYAAMPIWLLTYAIRPALRLTIKEAL